VSFAGGRGASAGWRAAGWLLLVAGVSIRLHNALSYPPDWGFDASFNWRYIYRLTEDRALPTPDAGWATGDPPLYFALGALVMGGAGALGARDLSLVLVPLLGTAAGLAIVGLAAALVRRLDPARPGRAWLAALLLLYLPAHVQMSVMVNEEILAALFVSLAVFGLVASRAGSTGPPARPEEPRRAAAVGLAAGLAVLTKLSGVLAALTAVLTYAIEGWRRRALRSALVPIGLVGLVVLASGGWYYAANRVQHGYFQPFGLPAHQMMFRMPPGERGIGDYLRVPLATWTDPQLLHPDLLRSVWGSTYATLWFDGHRYFLPRDDPAVRRLGTATLLLALLPTLAFAVGLGTGLRRCLRRDPAPDLPLLLLVGLVWAGYAAYTWRNPWFAVVKGTSLLGLCLPFAVYASETLHRWLRRGGALGWGVGVALAALVACSAATTTFDGLFEKGEVSGLAWEAAAEP
jgi:hypothetical protein